MPRAAPSRSRRRTTTTATSSTRSSGTRSTSLDLLAVLDHSRQRPRAQPGEQPAHLARVADLRAPSGRRPPVPGLGRVVEDLAALARHRPRPDSRAQPDVVEVHDPARTHRRTVTAGDPTDLEP